MNQKARATAIGAFVVGASALAVIGIGVFGSGSLFAETTTWVAYFDESVSGLGVGAPVSFRGVKIGEVKRITVEVDANTLSTSIPVILEVRPERLRVAGVDHPTRGLGQELIEKGLRAQLQTQSLVTGQLGIQLDLRPDRPAVYVDSDLGYPQIPTIPSTLYELQETFQNLSIEQLIADARRALQGFSELVNSDELQATVEGMNQAVAELRSLVRNIDGRVGPLASNIDRTLDEARDSLSIAAEGSPVRYEMSQVLKELASAARSVRVLVQYLERNPDALLRGKRGSGDSP